jgi:CheY-like chemotaxis protein
MIEKLNRILIVEDEPDIQTVARLALETLGGYTLEVCNSGNEALEKIIAFEPQFILLDVMMPGMDGPSTLQKIREIHTFIATPTVFLTAKVQPSEIVSYKAIGAIDVISKPFDPMNLSKQVQAIWEWCHV